MPSHVARHDRYSSRRQITGMYAEIGAQVSGLDDRPPAFSRTGISSPLGKLTEQIPAVRVSIETKEALDAEAKRAGMTLLEFVREVLIVRAHGEEEVLRMYADRVSVVSGKSRES